MSDASHKPGWDAGHYHRAFDFIHRLGANLIEQLDPKPGETILDLGCGTGKMAAEIAARGAHVIGLDSDPTMIEHAKAAHPALEFICASGESFRLKQPVDGIISNAALHWMTRPQRVINAMARALKPGGRLALEMGGHGNVVTVVEAIYAVLAEAGVPEAKWPRPWYFPRIGEYCTRLERGGFEVAEAVLFDRPTPLDDLKDGMADWLRMFMRPFLVPLPLERHAEAIAAVVERTRPRLCPNGRWVVDYRRLRVLARRGARA